MNNSMIPLLALAAAGLLRESKIVDFHHPAHRARANLASFISDEDYPADALRRGEQGIVGFSMDIDAIGRVSACRITLSSGSATLDETTCRIARERVQFRPALDRHGRPVPDQASSRIRWVLPDTDSSNRPQANLASYISDDDYPAEAIRRGEQGVVGFMLTVGTNGVVSACEVVSSSGSSALDQATCTIMQARARFNPARDSGGRAIPDAVKAHIRWVLPPDEAASDTAGRVDLTSYIASGDYPTDAVRRREEGLVVVELSVSGNGRVTQCAVTGSSGSAALDARTCEILRPRARFETAHDEAGNAVATVVEGSVHWTLPTP